MLGARINDQYKSYFWAYIISAVMLVIGAALAMLTKSPAAVPSQAQSAPAQNPAQTKT
jgi:hypothetical protein